MKQTETIQLSKAIALSGFCSRKQAEKFIKNNQVAVDGQIIPHASFQVSNDQKIIVDGKKIQFSTKIKREIWAFHKSAGTLTTHHDPEGRSTIFDFMPNKMQRYHTIGRLDFNSEGLLLLTNDGGFARHMELPENKVPRGYEVEVFGKIPAKMWQITRGININGMFYKPQKIELIWQKNLNAKLHITLTEGKNREIRNIMQFFNLQIKRLIRVSFCQYKLNNLPKKKLILLS